MDDKFSRKSRKNKKQKKNGEASQNVISVDPNDKFNTFKAIVRLGDNEFIQEKKGKDPYEYINKKVQKIEVNPRVPYRSTSMDEVFEIRNQFDEVFHIEEQNRFIQTKKPTFSNVDDPNLFKPKPKPPNYGLWKRFKLWVKGQFYKCLHLDETEKTDPDAY